jgi:antitoxin component of MazEF toxin-antitoxin module
MFIPLWILGVDAMIKRLTRHGNSLALVIDRAILELLKVDPDTPLELSTDGDVLIVRPLREQSRRARFEDALGQVNARFGGVLRGLGG